MDIELICTGDEVLTGKIINTNAAWIAQKLEDYGLTLCRGQTVGDDREELLAAFIAAGKRADVVIVNGGLGPTVDDLSQEVAAQAAEVELELNGEWLARMKRYFEGRGRPMSANNTKQAMLPHGSELIDNPIGTACGFGVDIGKARFYFTPGVPRELHRMLEEQLIPRMLDKLGRRDVIVLKRFHSYGLGESHADQLLSGLEALVPDGSLKLGFRAHYPQLETKLTVRGSSSEDVERKLAPINAEVHRRMGNFILAEDGETVEGIVLDELAARQGTLAVVESFTGGQVAARMAPQPQAPGVLHHGLVLLDSAQLRSYAGLSANGGAPLDEQETCALASALREKTAATHALAVLVHLSHDESGPNLTGTISIAIAEADGTVFRGSNLRGNRDWVRLGATEMGLDSLRRHLRGLPLEERTDFEKR